MYWGEILRLFYANEFTVVLSSFFGDWYWLNVWRTLKWERNKIRISSDFAVIIVWNNNKVSKTCESINVLKTMLKAKEKSWLCFPFVAFQNNFMFSFAFTSFSISHSGLLFYLFGSSFCLFAMAVQVSTRNRMTTDERIIKSFTFCHFLGYQIHNANNNSNDAFTFIRLNIIYKRILREFFVILFSWVHKAQYTFIRFLRFLHNSGEQEMFT